MNWISSHSSQLHVNSGSLVPSYSNIGTVRRNVRAIPKKIPRRVLFTPAGALDAASQGSGGEVSAATTPVEKAPADRSYGPANRVAPGNGVVARGSNRHRRDGRRGCSCHSHLRQRARPTTAEGFRLGVGGLDRDGSQKDQGNGTQDVTHGTTPWVDG